MRWDKMGERMGVLIFINSLADILISLVLWVFVLAFGGILVLWMLLFTSVLMLSLASGFCFEGIQVLRGQRGWPPPGVTSRSLTVAASWRQIPPCPGVAGWRISHFQVSGGTLDLESWISLPVLSGQQPNLSTFEVRGQLHFVPPECECEGIWSALSPGLSFSLSFYHSSPACSFPSGGSEKEQKYGEQCQEHLLSSEEWVLGLPSVERHPLWNGLFIV